MSSEEINALANWIVLAAIIPFAAFTGWYCFASPWWKSVLGIVMLELGASITLVLGVVILRRTFGEYPGYEWVAIFSYSALTVAAVNLLVIFAVERRRRPLLQMPLNRRK